MTKMTKPKPGTLAYYRDWLGFDLTTRTNWTRQRTIRCSQCQALVINNVPTHEKGCPNWRKSPAATTVGGDE